ncbi:acetyl-CoA C-acyltransferase [Amphiplicatus metriothermophilus]|uniref:Acetyl-CoA C-acetyltransferase n=1 Tax=Amphiplicatus metriothermophilus TaxID=1519374 RepID=A0A239PZX1_9PROT|nr:acetyl-CoA C-acyltransferase [Amphiplicatus metriothermophilus]MBB5519773.1 acetyl-CoA C-acetyltransferase [Amphiplicatus metriothermophilus]SNT75217.1 acetyl-CoA C-acetyltransferase [Amphiplicatus metriothermophilus]
MTVADPIVIVGMARTPIGNFQGAFAGVPATELGARAIGAALERAGLEAEAVDEVLMGCVLPAGLGQAPARQASRGAGIPDSAGCVTVNKVCGSGMKAAMIAHDEIAAGSAGVVVAGGMESMTNAPHLLPSGRSGIKFGHGEILDHMAWDGLEDAYSKRTAMGVFAEKCAREWQFSREEQDEFSMRSVTRAQKAVKDGTFADEIVPVVVTERKSAHTVSDDEKPGLVDASKIPSLRPAFEKDGTVTAGSSSAISDGAAAFVLMRASEAERRGLSPVARIVGHATHSQAPEWFTTAPVDSIRKLLTKVGWSASEVDLFEINEAFAVVPMAAMRELKLPAEKVNVHGGAIALGHPIGASGARIVVTLINALKKTGGKKGVASLCIGGGEATSLAVELA